MPLLQYLALYQAIEYFFPTFHQRDLIMRVRNQLRDPRIDPTSEEMAKRILGLTQMSDDSASAERVQLRTTLAASIEDSELRNVINNTPNMAEFLQKKTNLSGVPPISLKNPDVKLVDQLARRSYAIRCRIVHSKDSSSGHAEPLLPYSRETSQLAFDLKLIEFACQKVIIAGSESRNNRS
jgi:hypothetical protein